MGRARGFQYTPIFTPLLISPSLPPFSSFLPPATLAPLGQVQQFSRSDPNGISPGVLCSARIQRCRGVARSWPAPIRAGKGQKPGLEGNGSLPQAGSTTAVLELFFSDLCSLPDPHEPSLPRAIKWGNKEGLTHIGGVRIPWQEKRKDPVLSWDKRNRL